MNLGATVSRLLTVTAPKPPKTPTQVPPRTPGESVAKAFVEAYSDPEWEKKEAQAQAEKEARMREALKKMGVLKGGAKK